MLSAQSYVNFLPLDQFLKKHLVLITAFADVANLAKPNFGHRFGTGGGLLAHIYSTLLKDFKFDIHLSTNHTSFHATFTRSLNLVKIYNSLFSSHPNMLHCNSIYCLSSTSEQIGKFRNLIKQQTIFGAKKRKKEVTFQLGEDSTSIWLNQGEFFNSQKQNQHDPLKFNITFFRFLSFFHLVKLRLNYNF